MTTWKTYSRSRFASNCEPMTPFRKLYGKGSMENQKAMKRKDIFQETSDFCQKTLEEIKEEYDKSICISESKAGVISFIKISIMDMTKKANRIGVDPERTIRDGENNSEIKKKILNDIRNAQNLLTLIEITV